MSPATLRRYRAEQMLQRDFDALRGRVLGGVRARLRCSGASVDDSDLEACYASAWQGLYSTALRGEEIESPAAWLVLVTYRRAIEEHRARLRREAKLLPAGSLEPDLDRELDDRMRLARLFEGMRGRLDARERQAATLCYLQGYSRAEAASAMGISERRMRKLMEGRGPGRPGVSAKLGALVETISAGEFCAERASLIRALAFGLLRPGGERHGQALAHLHGCPACRSYVASLRGLAAALPPVLPPAGAAGGGVLAALARAGHTSIAGPAGAGALPASGAAGAGAGGGWLLVGGSGAKLAVGCLVALGVGAGCVALGPGGHTHRPPARIARAPRRARAPAAVTAQIPRPLASAASVRSQASTGPVPAAKAASREFGPEQPGSASTPAPAAAPPRARVAAAQPTVGTGGSGGSTGGSASREFSPG
jgi:DNA-directed RNA polymerase specialized sigma24 family protein